MSGRRDGDGGAHGAPRSVSVLALTHPRAIPLATVGLILVLLSLAAFSLATAVTNARAAARAEASAVVSERAQQTLSALVREDTLAGQVSVAVRDVPAARERYAAAHAAVERHLAGLAQAAEPARRPLVAGWAHLHTRYGQSVQVMLVVAPATVADGEAFMAAYLDPDYEALREALTEEVRRLHGESDAVVRAVGRFQRAMLVATPVVFGLGLALVVVFAVVVGRGRRLVLAQAATNRYQARHDALTGLPNRTLLRHAAEAALADASGRRTALLLIDLDRFKEINDTLGHRYGDLVLQVLAERLRAFVGDGAVVGRLGGDEFAVLLPAVGTVERALEIAVGVAATMDASIDAEGVFLDVDASIGLVVSGEHGDDVDTLLQHADIAMYRAKERGLGVCVYDPALNDHSREQLGLLGELRRAIETGELVLEFQPKVTLPDGGFCGAEALVRWRHPERGMLPPGLFVPVAERTALIHPLTRYVLGAALAECRRWLDEGRTLHVAVNVSVRNLLDDAFLPDVVALLARWRVPASCLELEVTESAVMADPERARSVLAAFAALGLGVSIDDFGAGYTSLAQLSRLPVHTLKIDRSLVSRMTVDRGDELIVRSVVELAHSLGLRTVAEGVEDEATRDLLGRHGCDAAQGYLFSRPVPAHRLVAWVDAVAAPAEPVAPAVAGAHGAHGGPAVAMGPVVPAGGVPAPRLPGRPDRPETRRLLPSGRS